MQVAAAHAGGLDLEDHVPRARRRIGELPELQLAITQEHHAFHGCLRCLRVSGQDKKLIGYFQADTGTINQHVHLWKFADDADRRAHWAAVYANRDFVEGFATKFRPLVASQEVKLLTAAPWGPRP